MNYSSIAFLNLLCCLGVTWVCICWLNTDLAKNVRLVRLRYTLLLTGALTCGFQPLLFNEYPGIGTCFFSATTLIAMLVHLRQSRRFAV